MTHRKFTILAATPILCVQKLMEMEEKSSPAKIRTVDQAINHAKFILKMIDERLNR
jgi:hypothetical protein